MIRDTELRLLAESCSAAIRGERLEGVEKSCDWMRFIQLARRHRVQGLAWMGLTGGQEPDFPQAAELLEDTKQIAHHNLLSVAAATQLRDEFERKGLAFVFLKGLTLGALSYPQAMLKTSTDIDLLVDPSEIDAAEQCLEGLGYELEGQSRLESRRAAAAKEWTWVRRDGVVVDLHSRLADNPALLSTVNTRSAKQHVEISPGIVLPTLTCEPLFAYLCVHGTSSSWFRLKWVSDLAAFLHRWSDDEIRSLCAAARSYAAGRCPDVALLVVEEFFGPQIPSDLLASAAREPVTRLLAGLSIRELTQVREPLDRPLGTGFIHLGQLFIERGLEFPVREFGRQFSSLTG